VPTIKTRPCLGLVLTPVQNNTSSGGLVVVVTLRQFHPLYPKDSTFIIITNHRQHHHRYLFLSRAATALPTFASTRREATHRPYPPSPPLLLSQGLGQHSHSNPPILFRCSSLLISHWLDELHINDHRSLRPTIPVVEKNKET
jgi:hypothetical protein